MTAAKGALPVRPPRAYPGAATGAANTVCDWESAGNGAAASPFHSSLSRPATAAARVVLPLPGAPAIPTTSRPGVAAGAAVESGVTPELGGWRRR